MLSIQANDRADLPYPPARLMVSVYPLNQAGTETIMFEHIQKIQGNVMAIKITGEITEDEHDRIDKLFQSTIAKWGRLRVFLVVKHYASFSSAEALYEDLRTVKLHADHIDRLAVVADRSWKSTWVGLFGLFSGITTDFFETTHIEKAWQWITQN